MNLTFACPHCQDSARTDISSRDAEFSCPQCSARIDIPAGAWDGRRLTRCLVCPSTDLFVRKDFPQRLGVAIVVLGFAISCITWNFYWVKATFVVLFATVVIDVLLYWLVGSAVMCYRCHAQYRGLDDPREYAAFDLETHERYRQQAARLAEHAAAARYAAPKSPPDGQS